MNMGPPPAGFRWPVVWGLFVVDHASDAGAHLDALTVWIGEIPMRFEVEPAVAISQKHRSAQLSCPSCVQAL